MLKFFFNRESWMVRLMEVVGVTFSILYLKRTSPPLHLTTMAFLFLFLTYIFIRLCDLIPWHGASGKGTGVRVHFQKSLVPTSYILAITSGVCLLEIPLLSQVILALSLLMMIVIAPVNAILIYFHSKDRDPLPINYFSSNEYLSDEK